MTMKSVKSRNLSKSVIQTIYDIVKAHGGELSLGLSSKGANCGYLKNK